MKTATLTSLSDHFLLAMPGLNDPHFGHSLTYVFEHNEHGAMGLIINRPLHMHLDEILTHMELSPEKPRRNPPVYIGGPVKTDRGFVLHRTSDSQWQSSYELNEHLSLTTSVDVLEAIAQDEGPRDYLIALGYAGWGEGQLEEEMANNFWLSCKADYKVIFNTPIEQRLDSAAQLLGINLSLLTTQAGHG
ncbi:YqgE/AlgH family protein [Pokkaliibacter sp. CJK22405]|uniref:YqgE/AlgH family protein n=1 Tax=Pokkaliibacter sp. CJK22405 TaxID=3384615 RepID=UPI003984D954